MATFGGKTLTETGAIKNDTINAADPKLGFGNLITNDGGKAINSPAPFTMSLITGSDVKWVHGDRWQQLDGYMTENVKKDFRTTIGLPPTISSGDKSGDLDYNDPNDDAAANTNDNQAIAPSGEADGGLALDPSDAEGGLPPSSTEEKTQNDPGKGQAQYILHVRGDQKTAIGGDTSLWVAGYSNTVQIGQYKASYFSQYIQTNPTSQYHNVPDSYQDMNNDYKIVYDTKYRNVRNKQDIAKFSLGFTEIIKAEWKSLQAAGALAHLTLGGINYPLWLLKNNGYALGMEAGIKGLIAPKANAAPSIGAGTPFR